MVEGAVNAAFQDREEAFCAVGMHVAANVLFGGVHDGFVGRKVVACKAAVTLDKTLCTHIFKASLLHQSESRLRELGRRQ